METKRLDGECADDILLAADLLTAGGLVAFPTETVYGLGADARDAAAVGRIYTAKGRPSNNPLIVHLHAAEEAVDWSADWNDAARALAAAFWPGPLTLVVAASNDIAREALAGGTTVGLRVPNHPVALALLKAARIPVAAPSANRSNRVSPTSAGAVRDELDGRIDAILDGGACSVGIESTVLDVTGEWPAILRPGAITAAMIAEIIGVSPSSIGGDFGVLRSPGMMPLHYAPSIRLDIVESASTDTGAFRIGLGSRYLREDNRIVLPRDAAEYARLIYETLRIAESSGAPYIHLERPPVGAEWDAIHDRLRRASSR